MNNFVIIINNVVNNEINIIKKIKFSNEIIIYNNKRNIKIFFNLTYKFFIL